ncbi:MAG: CAP domain-containing protein [Bacillus sp. (in: Bacteria)]|nr:CAP domain-containing protein [Bacillus sp. (in: firmicutes)]
MVTFENMFLTIIIGVVAYLFFSRNDKRKDNHAVVKGMQASRVKNTTTTNNDRPLHKFLNQPATSLQAQLGNPNRVDLSVFGHEWWIYHNRRTSYIQVGVYKGRVMSIYTMNNNKAGRGPTYTVFSRKYNFRRDIEVNTSHVSCQFHLSEKDIHVQPLISYGENWAVLSFDTFTKDLSGIWYLTPSALLMYRPYSMSYSGRLPASPAVSPDMKREAEKGMARQIFEITNVIRARHQLSPLDWDDESAGVALGHSKDMFENHYFSHTSPTRGELSHRFQRFNIPYRMIGENIAAKQVTSFAAVEGWLNSPGHRVNLLHQDFTHLGVGVYGDCYTQNFLTKLGQPS